MPKELMKGIVACKGRVTSVAKVFSDISAIPPTKEKGFILVVPFTTPMLIPLIMQSSAIITDTGGLTSHTAIVAREFNIPCIVGTKNATKLITTGQEVIVDANKGIIYTKN